ncbi:hypothetical protein C8Q80DRAFT_1168893 [Daedaleopsis nitida]|nr:hypothetical protein C8Q80DRAFT_1168893 [Daedaleopsis nitida]
MTTTFDLRNRQLRFNTGADVEPLSKVVHEVDSLEGLYLAYNTFGISGAEALGEHLSR